MRAVLVWEVWLIVGLEFEEAFYSIIFPQLDFCIVTVDNALIDILLVDSDGLGS